MKFEEIKKKATEFYYEHEFGIWMAIDSVLVVACAATWHKVGYNKGVYDCGNAIQRTILDADPETFLKVDKIITEATKK